MKRYSFFLALAAMLVLSLGPANGQSMIYLNGFDGGYTGADTIVTGNQVVWTFALRNNTGHRVVQSDNGFVVYAVPESSVTWVPIVIDTLDISGTGAGWGARYDFFVLIYPGNELGHPPTTGIGRDTVGIGGLSISGPGFQDSFDASIHRRPHHRSASPQYQSQRVSMHDSMIDHSRAIQRSLE